jgi:membrane fusion protein, copper/silver efflux system
MNLLRSCNGILFLSCLLLFAGCSKEQKTETEEHHGEHAGESSTIVHLDKHKVFHAAIQTENVHNTSVAVPLTLPGKVSLNERRVADITARVSGRIEKLNVFTNDRVNAGAALAQLYSQDVLTMQNEFLLAAERWNRTQRAATEDNTKAIYESAKRKLIVVGMSERDLNELEATRTPQLLFTVRAPFGGTILDSKIRQGAFVQMGTELFGLADLSTVWVLADIYEKDLPSVRNGMNAHVTVTAYPDSFIGRISTIYSVLDEKTRTVKARVEVQNRNGKLKPEMFCNVMIETQYGKETIKIPASALLGETEKHFVFVALNDTTFERREIRTGRETRDFAEVLDGLLVGEKLVVKGGFFLKSELAKETFGEEH